MQGFNIKENPVNTGKMLDRISPEDKQRLVGAFAWLIQEDKKQNPAFYQIKINKEKQND